jgi:two-component system, NtrC family, sensor kinase
MYPLDPDVDSIRVLIVEDDEDDVFLIKELLKEKFLNINIAIEHVYSPEPLSNLLEAAKNTDICIFDYRLGSLHGLDLLKKMREQDVITPVIFLTGRGDQEIAVQAFRLGATDYLAKSSLSAEQLFHSVCYSLNLSKEEGQRRFAEKKLKSSHEELILAHEELKKSMSKLQTVQNKIVVSEKMASIGRLAAAICHEILNPLNIISGHVQVLKMERAEEKDLLQDLSSINEEILRIEKIVNGLLKFSRKGQMDLAVACVHQELESVLTIVEKEMNLQNISVVREFDAKLPKLNIDCDRIRQVFLNIFNNAMHAMPDGGALIVRTSFVQYPENQLKEKDERRYNRADYINDKLVEFPHVKIEFADTGVGISKDAMDKIFEPLFTTKPEGKGTGLGLSVCHAIVEKHGGSIQVQSEPCKGAVFIVNLPVNPPKETAKNIEEEDGI